MESLVALASLTFVASITPGPNNLMRAASGVGSGDSRGRPITSGGAAAFQFVNPKAWM